MDPNETLEKLRSAMARLESWIDHDAPRPNIEEALWDATEAFEALDEWLSKGGFLPTAWKGVS